MIKKSLLTILLSITIVSLAKSMSLAQSNVTKSTKVGSPPTSASSCPIPNWTISCGSQNVPVNGCGHCGQGYGSYSCVGLGDGIYYAMDVHSSEPGGSSPLDPVFMPSVEGAKIKWVFSHQLIHKDGITAIQYYGGTNENNGEQYWIQFHHTKPGSGAGVKYSGEQGAQLCQAGCETGSGPHVHIEFAKVTPEGQRLWQDAPHYFCKGE